MLNTSSIWCLPLQHPSPCYISERRRQSQGTARLNYWVTDASLWLSLKQCKRKKVKILSPLFLITNTWLGALMLYKSLDSSWSGDTVLEAWVYCVVLSAGWELKPPFYFLQTLSPYFCVFGFSGQRRPRFWPVAQPSCLQHSSSNQKCKEVKSSRNSVLEFLSFSLHGAGFPGAKCQGLSPNWRISSWQSILLPEIKFNNWAGWNQLIRKHSCETWVLSSPLLSAAWLVLGKLVLLPCPPFIWKWKGSETKQDPVGFLGMITLLCSPSPISCS